MIRRALELREVLNIHTTKLRVFFDKLDTKTYKKDVKISASQVWLGNYTSGHLISSYIYVAYGYILAGTIKTINHISTGYKLRFRRDYN
jgi:hypothetical protein